MSIIVMGRWASGFCWKGRAVKFRNSTTYGMWEFFFFFYKINSQLIGHRVLTPNEIIRLTLCLVLEKLHIKYL